MKTINYAICMAALLAPSILFAQASPEQETETAPVQGSVYSQAVESTHVASEERMKAGSNDEEVICRRDKIIGSRVAAKKVCKTARQWEIEQRDQRELVERGQNQRTLSGG